MRNKYRKLIILTLIAYILSYFSRTIGVTLCSLLVDIESVGLTSTLIFIIVGMIIFMIPAFWCATNSPEFLSPKISFLLVALLGVEGIAIFLIISLGEDILNHQKNIAGKGEVEPAEVANSHR